MMSWSSAALLAFICMIMAYMVAFKAGREFEKSLIKNKLRILVRTGDETVLIIPYGQTFKGCFENVEMFIEPLE
jgi:hypothetical protein